MIQENAGVDTSGWAESRKLVLGAQKRKRLAAALETEFKCKFGDENLSELGSVQDWVNLVRRSMTAS